jgi:hypothetical protein
MKNWGYNVEKQRIYGEKVLWGEQFRGIKTNRDESGNSKFYRVFGKGKRGI